MGLLNDLYQKAKKKIADFTAPTVTKAQTSLGDMARKTQNTMGAVSTGFDVAKSIFPDFKNVTESITKPVTQPLGSVFSGIKTVKNSWDNSIINPKSPISVRANEKRTNLANSPQVKSSFGERMNTITRSNESRPAMQFSDFPVVRAVKEKSFKPLYEDFTTAEGRKKLVSNAGNTVSDPFNGILGGFTKTVGKVGKEAVEGVAKKIFPTNKNTQAINAYNQTKNAKAAELVSSLKGGVRNPSPIAPVMPPKSPRPEIPTPQTAMRTEKTLPPVIPRDVPVQSTGIVKPVGQAVAKTAPRVSVPVLKQTPRVVAPVKSGRMVGIDDFVKNGGKTPKALPAQKKGMVSVEEFMKNGAGTPPTRGLATSPLQGRKNPTDVPFEGNPFREGTQKTELSGKIPALDEFVREQGAKFPQQKPMQSIGTKMPSMEDWMRKQKMQVFKNPRPGEIIEKNLNARQVVPRTKTISDVYDRVVVPAGEKVKRLADTAGDLLETTPEGRKAIFDPNAPNVFNYGKQLRAIGAIRNKKDLDKISFEEGKKILDDWRMKNNPGYPAKKAERKTFENFVSDYKQSETKGIERGIEYLKKLSGLSYKDADEAIYFLDSPQQAPSHIAEIVSGIRKEFDDLYREARDAGIDEGYIHDYISHIWRESPRSVSQKIDKAVKAGILTADDLADAGKTTDTPFFGFAVSRKLKTYKAGEKIGLHKRYNHPAQILAHYVKQMEQAKSIIRGIQSLKESGEVIDGVADGMKPLTVRGMEGLSGTPEIANKLENAFGDHEYSTLPGKMIGGAAAVSRKLKDLLMSGGIPLSTINSYGIGMTLKEIGTLSPTRAFNAVSSFVVANSPKASRKFFEENIGQIKKIQKNDMQISTMLDDGGFVDKGFWKNLLGDHSGQGFLGGMQVHWDKLINEPTFQRYLPMSQVKFFNSVESRLLKKGYDPMEAERIAAKELREGFGLGSAAKEAQKTQLWKDWRETLFFAPTHRMNMIRVFGNAFKSFGRNPFARGNQSAAQFLAGGAAVYAAYDWVNYKNTGHHLWENPTGKKFETYINTGDGNYISIPFMPSVATIPRLAIDVAERATNGGSSIPTFSTLGDATMRAWQGAGSLLSKPLADVAMNEDYFGRQIANPKDDSGKQLADSGKYLVKSYTGHPWIKAGMDAYDGKPMNQLLVQATEAPVRFTTEDKLASGKFWDTYNEVKPVYEKFARMMKEGNADAPAYYAENKNAIESYKSLSATRQFYTDLKDEGKQDQFGSVVKNDGFRFGINTASAEAPSNSATTPSGNVTQDKLQKKYNIGKAMTEFEQSTEPGMFIEDRAFLRSSDGTISNIPRASFDSQVLKAKMAQSYDNKDVKSWLSFADEDRGKMESLLNDASLNDLEKIKVQNDLHDLVVKIEKYRGQGGFTKGTSSTVLNETKLNNLKKKGNFEEWKGLADTQYQAYMADANNPNISENKRMQAENKALALKAEAEKYAQYGGFQSKTTLNAGKLENMKKKGDFEGWKSLADKQYQQYMSEANNENLSEGERMQAENKALAIRKEMETYAKYGGFKYIKQFDMVPFELALMRMRAGSPITGKSSGAPRISTPRKWAGRSVTRRVGRRILG